MLLKVFIIWKIWNFWRIFFLLENLVFFNKFYQYSEKFGILSLNLNSVFF